MSPTLLLAADTPAPQRLELRSICRSLDFEAVDLGHGDDGSRDATVVAGVLPAGARTIPPAIMAAWHHTAGATLLLLADEQLVRPVVTLKSGRVVVVGNSTSSSRLRGVLQMMAPDDGVKSLWRSQLSAFAWSAHARPTSCWNDAEGVIAIVPFASDAPRFETRVEPTEEGVRSIATIVKREAGVVCVAPATREWLVYWPRVDRQAWLHSGVRLPNVTDLRSRATRADGHIVRFPVEPGDVALLLSQPIGSESEMHLALAEGGPSAVDSLDAPTGGLVVEVR